MKGFAILKKKYFLPIALVFSLALSGCSTGPASSIAEQEGVIPFLPTSELPSDVNIQPSEFTADLKKLKASYNSFDLKEGPGGRIDYYLNWGDKTYTGAGEQSEKSLLTTRERDLISLAFYAPDIEVLTDGRVNIKFLFKFDPHGKNLLTLCNGVLIEAAGEAIKLPTSVLETCDLETPDDQTRLYQTAGEFSTATEDAEVTRVFGLLAQNTFTVRLVDQNGEEHIFNFDKSRKYPSPQAFFTKAFEAAKAVKMGLGY